MEDEKIIGLFFERSEQAIKELDIKYGKLCHKLSHSILNSWPDVEECVCPAYSYPQANEGIFDGKRGVRINAKKFSEAMGELDHKYVNEAIRYQSKSKKHSWAKWTSIAACFALLAVLGMGVWQGGWFGESMDTATLSNGNTINFVKSGAACSALSIDMDVTFRELTAEEIHKLFGELPVSVQAVFTATDHKLIGFDGKVKNVKLVISTSHIPLLDTVIEGEEESTEVNGVSVTAGYFLTDPNSKGERTAIYYAAFELGGRTVYVENAGAQSQREAVKNELATIIQALIENGELDLTGFGQ